MLGNWWSHKILQADTQISPVSGSIKEQVVTFLGKKKINLYGKIYNVDHFTLKSKRQKLFILLIMVGNIPQIQNHLKLKAIGIQRKG